MHFPAITPRKSLYYNYEVYPHFHSQEDIVADKQAVTIVGAGPIGMTTALLLAKQGVKVILLSAELLLLIQAHTGSDQEELMADLVKQ